MPDVRRLSRFGAAAPGPRAISAQLRLRRTAAGPRAGAELPSACASAI